MIILCPPQKNKLLGFLFLLVTYCSISQISPDVKEYKEKYPNAQVVRLKQNKILHIGFSNDQFNITQESLEEDLYLYESAKYDAKQSLEYSAFFELEKIEASTYILKNGKYNEIKVSDFKVKDELSGSFYDDVKSVNFIFPSLGKGTKSKLEHTQQIKNPRFLSPMYFGGFHPIEDNKYTIVADKSITLRFKEINVEGVSIAFTKKSTRKNNIYTWHLKNTDEYKYEDRAPNYKSILPHIIPIIVSYQNNGKTVKLLENVVDLYKWYYSLVEHINEDPGQKDLIQLVKELTANKENEFEKVKAIYYWVQENVKYVAFEYALGGFVPREANDVFNKKYGDCKDNSSLLFKMLQIAGIKSNLTWIGTRSIPYTYEEVPTPIVDNHMILHYEYNGKSFFLDATGRFNPLEVPTSFIQGKEALVSINKDSFAIKKVPVIDPLINRYNEKVTLQLEGNNLYGSSIAELSGYGKINHFYNLEKKNNQEDLLELYNSAFEKGNNSFQITNLKETNKFSYTKDLVVNYEFNISNYVKVLGNEIYLNLNLNKYVSSLKTEKDRAVPLEHKYLDSFNFEYAFKIPEGYVVDYLPEGITIINKYFEGKITYQLQNNEIIYKHNFKLNKLIFKVDALKEINLLVKQIDQQYKEVVVLKKRN